MGLYAIFYKEKFVEVKNICDREGVFEFPPGYRFERYLGQSLSAGDRVDTPFVMASRIDKIIHTATLGAYGRHERKFKTSAQILRRKIILVAGVLAVIGSVIYFYT